MRRIPTRVMLVVSFAGCTPQSAQIEEGSDSRFMALLAHSTSPTLLEGKVKLADDAPTVDCRKLDDPGQRLANALPICADADYWPPKHESWLTRDAFHIYEEELVPWRGEAVITSEGDLQVTFHHRLTGGEDFRFAFVVDPVFQPRVCAQTADGGVALEDIDGDWLGSWSEDEPGGGRMFYLNSGAYQFNPSDTTEVWALPNEWAAGYTIAKFAAEDLFPRTVRYGLPKAYANFEVEEGGDPTRADLFYVPMQPGSDPNKITAFADQVEAVQAVAALTSEELALLGWDMTPRVHTNDWREPDASTAGLDGWVELHYNWVHFDAGSTLDVGGSASGEFNLVYDAGESQSRAMVKGRFVIDRISKDRWVTRDVMAEKLRENETVLCGVDFGEE